MAAKLNIGSFASPTSRHFLFSGSNGLLFRPTHASRVRYTVTSNSFQARLRSTAEIMPKIAQASTWQSIIPKFFRSRRSDSSPKPTSKEWNPATFYVVIWTLIGSQAIQMLVLRKDFENYTRKADAKIRLLREVIQKVNNGESVDVERLLGTGDEVKEREWEEVLREIEDEDSVWRQKSHDQRQREGTTPESNDMKEKSSLKESKPASSSSAGAPTIESAKITRFY